MIESVKSFIQFILFSKIVSLVVCDTISLFGNSDCGMLLNNANMEKNFVGFDGTKGINNNINNKNHKLYCIRLVKIFLNNFLTTKRIPMIQLIHKLQMRKRIIKSLILLSSFL